MVRFAGFLPFEIIIDGGAFDRRLQVFTNDVIDASTTSNGVPVSTACIASPSSLARIRLTTNPGVSRVMTAFL